MRLIRSATLTSVLIAVLGAASLLAGAPSGASAEHLATNAPRLLVSGLQGTFGSTVGPDGALYVPEVDLGRIDRIDPETGRTTVFTSGLPRRIIPVGGAMDVAFLGRTAYALVSNVGPDLGGSDTVGIYRVDGRHHSTVVADIGAYTLANPPATPFFLATGVQFAMQSYRGKLIVTDGHHNRVYEVTRGGHISEVETFADVVPTGLAVHHGRLFMTEAGAVPHLPENGRVFQLDTRAHRAVQIASGAPLLVDVEFAGRRMYALSQGLFPVGNPEGSPASPNTGSIVRVHRDGRMTPILRGINQPTSLEFIGRTGYIVTLTGEIWRIPCLAARHNHQRCDLGR